MEARGFTKSDVPDLVINFSFDEEDKIRTRQVPSASYHDLTAGICLDIDH
jgi:hypothetical protein